MADDRIVLDVQNTIVGSGTGTGTTGTPANGVPMAGGTVQSVSKNSGFAQGISAQMFVESASRIISATGNTELASGISKASSYGFLGTRLISSGGVDVAAWVSLLTKASADVIQAIQEYNQKKKDEAKNANALDMLRMRGGAFSINANTQISYNKYGRVSFTDRR